MTILETERLIAFFDHRPLFYGHTLLVPKLDVQLLSELPAERSGWSGRSRTGWAPTAR